jgi:hypothetical protein
VLEHYTAAIFRAVEEWHPITLILDEADSYMSKYDEARGVLNSGHNRRAAYVVRVVEVGKKAAKPWGSRKI